MSENDPGANRCPECFQRADRNHKMDCSRRRKSLPPVGSKERAAVEGAKVPTLDEMYPDAI